MSVIKREIRCCMFCSHLKPDYANLAYYCSNQISEHYLETIKDIENEHWCKGGNAKKQRNSK